MRRNRRILYALLLTAFVCAAFLAGSAEDAPRTKATEEANTARTESGEDAPDEPKAVLTVSVTGSEQTKDGDWQMSYQSTADTMEIRISAADGAAGYRVKIICAGETRREKECAGTTLTVPLSDFLPEDAGERTGVTLNVTALSEDGSAVSSGSLALTLIRQSGKRPGGRSGRSKSGGAAQGFHVTPGSSLINSHTNGDKDARLYGSVEISASAEPTERLSLGNTEIVSDGDGFTVALAEGALTLAPVSACEAWTFSAKALKTLRRSGVHTLTLFAGGRRIEFSTDLQMKGDIYAALSARGIVSKDYAFTVTADGTRVAVAGEQYLFTADNELAKIGG